MRSSGLPPRRWVVRGVLACVVLLVVGSATAATVEYEPATLGSGTVDSAATNQTIVSVQGFHFQGVGNRKKPARLVSAGPDGGTDWVYNGSGRNTTWFYDVDPLPDGNLLVTSTVPGDTVVYELDRETREVVWSERFDAEDTHDVDLINGDELLVANMRNYDAEAGVNDDRIFVYNRTRGEIVWEWTVRNHYPRTAGGDYTNDWTHVNDVDKVDDGQYLVSLRNFDQVVVVNRSTKAIDMRLGSDGDHDTLYEQHNPDYLESANGTPTLLVADSENDRVVEYARRDGEWELTWELSGAFEWPRDADRLPNGNTLVTDTLNHRVVEVTPRGRVVWETYAPWAPYDAERLGTGPGSNGPTIADMNESGAYNISGGSVTDESSVGAWLQRQGLTDLGERYGHVVPFVRPVWMPSWAFAGYVAAALLLLGWGLGELLVQRRRVRRLLGRLRERVVGLARQ
ncbi:aryl-sulfate sulfotransferase [Halorientalis salina]|uniref:aryl-sulfate sulfotransferase n=1 Tax=Halorientalis salina TaxID=2932266 RepID=UPI0010ABA82E|nr:aryl-sulfate sulfotransferase [Halorientalis salina]